MPTLQECIDIYYAAQARRLNGPELPTGPALPGSAVAERIDSEITHSEVSASSCSGSRSATADPDLTPTGRLRWTDESRWAWGAKKIGISFEAYRQHVLAGRRWCSGDRAWEPVSEFGPSRRYGHDGLQTACRAWTRDNDRQKMRALRAERRSA